MLICKAKKPILQAKRSKLETNSRCENDLNDVALCPDVVDVQRSNIWCHANETFCLSQELQVNINPGCCKMRE